MSLPTIVGAGLLWVASTLWHSYHRSDPSRETYENRTTRSITIHRPCCGHLRKHGGTTGYTRHETMERAISYARSTGLRVRSCQVCGP